MIYLRIDDQKLKAEEGETIFEVATRNGIKIPALCYHAGVEAWGGCRLCSVEITKESWEGWSRLVVSCQYPAEKGLIVYTNSEKVKTVRKTLVDLLLARCPETEAVRELAAEYGIEETSFVKREDPDDCILCGLCVRVCASVGAHAIATAGRGIYKDVTVPFYDDASDCVGCLSCATNCPTGHIKYEESDSHRKIWERTFDLIRCTACGCPVGTPEQIAHYAKKTGLEESYFEKCDRCRKQETGSALGAVTEALKLEYNE